LKIDSEKAVFVEQFYDHVSYGPASKILFSLS